MGNTTRVFVIISSVLLGSVVNRALPAPEESEFE